MPGIKINCTSESYEMNETSPEMASKILRQLNAAKAQLYIPALVYMVLLMVAGVIGNSLVVYVYIQRLKRTSSSYFIVSMAMFDLFSCCFHIPVEIYDLRHPYLFPSDVACKMFQSLGCAAAIGSALILVAVACDRYFKICRPFKNIPLQYMKRVCLAIAVCAFLMAIPSIFASGVKDVVTSYPGVVGKDCSLMNESRMASTFFLAWFAFFATLFGVCIVTMISLYIRIWVEIKRRQRQAIRARSNKSSGGDSDLPKSTTSICREPPLNIAPEKLSRAKYLPKQSISSDQNGGVEVTYKTRRRGSDTSEETDADNRSFRPIGQNKITKIKSTKMTVILFCATMAFILSYLPFIVLGVVKSKTIAPLSNKQDLAVQFFARSSFINNCINPIIYSFFNIRFRSECIKALGKLCQICLSGFRTMH